MSPAPPVARLSVAREESDGAASSPVGATDNHAATCLHFRKRIA
jgi:hypothetical protein